MKTDDKKIQGRGIVFSDGRKVDLFDLHESFAMRFTQIDGSETRVSLSYEAMMALVRLYIEAHGANSAVIEDSVVKFGLCA